MSSYETDRSGSSILGIQDRVESMAAVGEALAAEAVDAAGGVAGLRPDRAFEDEFSPMFRAAYKVAYRLSGSREDAADCAQEACARAYSDWKRLIRRGDVTPWVIRVSSNLAIDRWRKLQRARRIAAPDDLAAPNPDRVDLARALDTLPRRQRDVVVLRFVADLSQSSVANALGCSTGTVKTHAARALVTLRRTLGSEEESRL
jgi:RNA polymerase sigma factor (sigma-70 family)